MSPRSLAAILLLTTSFAACNRGCSCGKRKAAPAGLSSAAITEPRSELVNDGREPRAKLEVARWSGFAARMTVETEGSLALQGQTPIRMPAVVATLRLDTLRGIGDPIVTKRYDRELRLISERALIEKIELKPGQLPPDALAKMNEGLKAFSGTTMRQLVAEDGELVELKTELVGGVPPSPEQKQMLDSTLEMQRRFPFRTPSAPVGPGARWRFSEPIDFRGVRAIQVADMTLTALDDSTARIRIALRHHAPRQEVPYPLDPRQTAVLEHYRGDGEGELTIDRVTALLLEGRVTTTANLRLSVQLDGAQQSIIFVAVAVTRARSEPLLDAGAQPPTASADRPEAKPPGSSDAYEPSAPSTVP